MAKGDDKQEGMTLDRARLQKTGQIFAILSVSSQCLLLISCTGGFDMLPGQ